MQHIKITFHITLCWHLFTLCWANVIHQTGVVEKIDPQIDPFILQTGGSYIFMLRASTAYVDKTLFIKFILEHEKHVIWITLPIHWGKTANLKMLEAFCTPHIDENGDKEPVNQTLTYRFFKEGRIPSVKGRGTLYTRPPLISQHEDIMNEYLGQYPVIYIEFQAIGIDRNDFETFFSNFKSEIQCLYEIHNYLEYYLQGIINNTATSDADRKIAQEKLDKFELYHYFGNYTDVTMVEKSILFLSQLMYERFGKPVILLIEEFARVVNVMFMYSNYDKDTENKIIKILHNYVRHTITENPYVKKVVMSGVLEISKDIFFSNYTNLVHYSYIDQGDLLGFFGFLHHEVEALFKHFKIPSNQTQLAFDYYKAYTLAPKSNVAIYLPYSIVRFIDWKKIDKFFRDKANFFPVRNWFAVEKFRNMVKSALNGTEITVKSRFDFDQRDYVLPKAVDVWGKNHKVDDQAYDFIFTLLCYTGYFTLTNRTDQVTPPGHITLRIPNTEIWESLNETHYWNFTATRNRRFGLLSSTPC